MRKDELIQRISEDTGLKKDLVKMTIESLLRITTEALGNGEEIRFHNFGALSAWQQVGRPARNPKTGTPVMLTPRVSVKFRPGRLLLKALNE